MRLIDADILEKYIKRDEHGTPDERWRPESEFALLIDSQSTIEAEPIIHAHWILIEYGYLHCSHCGKSYYTGAETTHEAKECLKNGDYYPNCPFCRAKMDGKENEK